MVTDEKHYKIFFIQHLLQKLIRQSVHMNSLIILVVEGAQWLSGRMLDSRLRGCGVESHRRHCLCP